MAHIMAIDAGFVNMGWAMLAPRRGVMEVVDHGNINTENQTRKTKTRVGDDNARRCAELAAGLEAAYRTWGPVCVVVELPSGGSKSMKAAMGMGMALAICSAFSKLMDLPMVCITPQQGKKAATGKQHASKAEVIQGVQRAFPGLELQGNKLAREAAADAIAAFLAGQADPVVMMAQRVGG